ncbi:MAG: DUF561 domain-containing protein, partial [Xenococcaceae cyanobacterium]
MLSTIANSKLEKAFARKKALKVISGLNNFDCAKVTAIV